MFRMEVWTSKNMPEEKLKELEGYLRNNMGCELITVKEIKV